MGFIVVSAYRFASSVTASVFIYLFLMLSNAHFYFIFGRFLCSQLHGLPDVHDEGQECGEERNCGQDLEDSLVRESDHVGERLLALSNLKVKLVERVIYPRLRRHPVRNRTVLETASIVGPPVGLRVLIEVKAYSDADAFNDIVSVANATRFLRILSEDGILFAFLFILHLLHVLLPEEEIDSLLWVVFLPAELGVCSVLADWHVLDSIVVIEHFSINLGVPAQVEAVGLRVAHGHVTLLKQHIREIVMKPVRREVVIRDRFIEVLIVLVLPLGLSVLKHSKQHVSLRFLAGHDSYRHLDAFERFCYAIVINSCNGCSLRCLSVGKVAKNQADE